MNVGFDLPAKRGSALSFPPSLCERQEESLFAGQSVDDNVGFAFQRQYIRIMRRQQSRQVSDIFGQDLPAAHAKIGKRTVAVELSHQFLRCRVVFGEIVGSPPTAETALVVVNIASVQANSEVSAAARRKIMRTFQASPNSSVIVAPRLIQKWTFPDLNSAIR